MARRAVGSRCFVHIANALVWRAVTGEAPPTTPLTAKAYTDAGLPWFDYYYADRKALAGSEKLAEIRSVLEKARETGRNPLPENEGVEVERVVRIGDRRERERVREGGVSGAPVGGPVIGRFPILDGLPCRNDLRSSH